MTVNVTLSVVLLCCMWDDDEGKGEGETPVDKHQGDHQA